MPNTHQAASAAGTLATSNYKGSVLTVGTRTRPRQQPVRPHQIAGRPTGAERTRRQEVHLASERFLPVRYTL